MKNRRLELAMVYTVLLIWAILCLYPLLWMMGASLKTPLDVLTTLNLFPAGVWHWHIFASVWSGMGFWLHFWNSVQVSLYTLVAVNIIYMMAGFALAKLKFRGNEVVFRFFLGMMFVPGITMIVPIFLIEAQLHLLNTMFGLILPMVNGAGPFAIFLFRNYFRTIPDELFEAAKVDGAGIFHILFRIYVPLALPAIATISIFNFIGSWNGLILPLVLLSSQNLYTLPLAVMSLNTGSFTQWNVLMAGSLISLAPVIVVFVFLQKYFIRGLSSGAVKG